MFLQSWPLSGFACANPRIFDVQMSSLGLAMSRSVLAGEEPTKRRIERKREGERRSGMTSSNGGLVDRNAN